MKTLATHAHMFICAQLEVEIFEEFLRPNPKSGPSSNWRQNLAVDVFKHNVTISVVRAEGLVAKDKVVTHTLSLSLSLSLSQTHTYTHYRAVRGVGVVFCGVRGLSLSRSLSLSLFLSLSLSYSYAHASDISCFFSLSLVTQEG